MTDKLNLTPDLFTPQYGFVEGVVVEVTHFIDYNKYFPDTDLGYFDCVHDGDLQLRASPGEYKSFVADHYITLVEIKSIRLLTGPMRFWSGAPGWATHHIYLQADAKSEFFNDSGFGEWKKYGPLRPVTRRPWWCDFGKEGSV